MFSALLIHFIVWFLGAWLLGHALDRFIAPRKPHGGWVVFGLCLAAYLGTVLLWPFLRPGGGSLNLVRWIGSRGEAWAGKALVLGLAILCVWGIFRILRVWAERRMLRRMLLDPQAMAFAGEAWQEEEAFRSAVESQFVESLKRPVQVRYGARIVLPETFGLRPPVILLPHWLVRHPELHASAKVLLNLERERIRLGQAHWAECMTWIAAALPPLAPLRKALLRAMAKRAEGSLLAHSSPEAAARYRDAAVQIRAAAADAPASQAPVATRSVSFAWGILIPLGALLLAMPIRWTSPVDWRDVGQRQSVKLPQGFRTEIQPPGVEIRGLPGIGGDFPEGLLIDTRRVKKDLVCHLGLRFPVPPPERPVLHIRVHYRVTGTFSAPPRLRMQALHWFSPPGTFYACEAVDQDTVDSTAREGWAEASACLPPNARTLSRSEIEVWFTTQPGTRLELTQIHSSTTAGSVRPAEENAARQREWDAFHQRYFDLPAFNTGWHSLSEED